MLLTPQLECLVPSELFTVRSDNWLRRQLNHLWNTYFSDVPQANRVEIEFARPWKTRLGMISLSESGRTTYIGLNALLCEPQVPESVCKITIAHELVHYAHGFGSPLPRKHSHPHHGNVVSRELMARGLGQDLKYYQHWTTQHWLPFYYTQSSRPTDSRRTAR